MRDKGMQGGKELKINAFIRSNDLFGFKQHRFPIVPEKYSQMPGSTHYPPTSVDRLTHSLTYNMTKGQLVAFNKNIVSKKVKGKPWGMFYKV